MGHSVCRNRRHQLYHCQPYRPWTDPGRAGQFRPLAWCSVRSDPWGIARTAYFHCGCAGGEGENQLPDNVKSAHTMPLMSRGAYHLARFFPDEYQDMIISNVAFRPPFGRGPIAETINDSIDAGKNAVGNSMKLLKDEKN